MRVLSIGSDRKLFHESSAVFHRAMEYSSKLKQTHIVVFTLKNQGFKNFNKDNLFIYPTNSNSRWLFVFDAVRVASKIIVHEGLNSGNAVVTCQDPFEAGLVGYILKRKFYLPLQMQIHTDFLSTYFKNNLLNRLRVLIAKFIISRADGLRVVSSVISDSLKKHFPNLKAEVTVLPIFVDVEKIINREIGFDSRGKSTSVLMVSRFEKEKRIDDGLSAFKKLLDKKIDATLSIIGSGSEKERIVSEIERQGLANNVRLLEWENDIILSFKKSDIYLLTSEYEGYGMTLIEAGASGCPIVTTKVGLAKTDLFKDGYNSWVCPVGDVECLSSKLQDLIQNSDKRKLFKQRMQDSIKLNSVSRQEYVVKYTDLLKNLVKK